MGRPKLKIAVLTSSRAEFGIYLPLLTALKEDNGFIVDVIAFGTHISPFYGYTLNEILEYHFNEVYTLNTVLANDDPNAIATSYALTSSKFADFWKEHIYDLVFCLGDRYEMNAAVLSGIPYGVKFAHIHGGETTLGAMDNIYRHQITLASHLHFTASENFKNRVIEIIASTKNVYNVGALSIDNIFDLDLPSENEFRVKYSLNAEFALVTFHPETLDFEHNYNFAQQMYLALKNIAEDIFIVITMPNADTMGSIYREKIETLKEEYPCRVMVIENFGKINYFAAMKYAKFLLGNTSSGIIEAASFHKYVINVGNRQKGRLQSTNVINVSFDTVEICEAFSAIMQKGSFAGENVYYKPHVAANILRIIKSKYG